MTLKLVPDEEQPMTEDQVRAYLMQISTPMLDAFRVKTRSMRTSELIGLMGNPETLATLVGITTMNDEAQEIFMAGMIALANELDRRVPVPG